jgi:hypothetical protein
MGPPVHDFISESITPAGGTFDSVAMARGEPGLPAAFNWRGRSYRVVAQVSRWKDTSAEGGRAGGEVYLRRHYFKLHMDSGQVWTVYFVRQTPKSGPPANRWFLYLIDHPATPD